MSAMQPEGGTAVLDEVEATRQTAPAWVTIVWDDPVNLQAYVTHVFCSYFHYPKEKAQELMLQVHNDGKAVVATGSLEEMERDVNAMHSYGLWATLDRAR